MPAARSPVTHRQDQQRHGGAGALHTAKERRDIDESHRPRRTERLVSTVAHAVGARAHAVVHDPTPRPRATDVGEPGPNRAATKRVGADRAGSRCVGSSRRDRHHISGASREDSRWGPPRAYQKGSNGRASRRVRKVDDESSGGHVARGRIVERWVPLARARGGHGRIALTAGQCRPRSSESTHRVRCSPCAPRRREPCPRRVGKADPVRPDV